MKIRQLPQTRSLRLVLLALAICFGLFSHHTSAQKASGSDIERWRNVLKLVKEELKQSYYDPNFHGMDLETRFKLADEKMKTAESLGQLIGIVAQVLLELNDSHTRFVPPYNQNSIGYGWLMQAVGPDCFVRSVEPGSDAEAKGLRVGDKVLSIDGKPMDRTTVRVAKYFYYRLRPQASMTLVIEKPDKRQEQVTISSRVTKKLRVQTLPDAMKAIEAQEALARYIHRFHDLSEDVLIWKMGRFDLDEGELEDHFKKLKNRKALILDLRGNGGGYVYTLERFSGYFFDSNLTIAELKGRKELKPQVVRSQKEKAFKGQLVVLIDAGSASASEVFARLVQIQKRGIVIGDRSAGSVMQSRYHSLRVGNYEGMTFGVDVTEADVIMTDGKSLEHVGVTPDELLLPTAQEMSAMLDPVLTRAAELVGVKLEPKKAGELFPIDWSR